MKNFQVREREREGDEGRGRNGSYSLSNFGCESDKFENEINCDFLPPSNMAKKMQRL